MKLQHQTILITGGSSGIGLELAKQLINLQNTVIICGRSEEKLAAAKQLLPQLITIACDISNDNDRMKLYEFIQQHYPACNVLINNAAIVHRVDFRADVLMVRKAQAEINTNLLAPIALTKLFLPLFENTPNPAIINITTGLIYAPRAEYPIYNATKAALHSFTQVLRHRLKETNVKVIEVMMPVVDTPWHNGDVPKIAISTEVAVNKMLKGIGTGKYEVRVGAVKLLYFISRISPKLAFKIINGIS
ncbi:SDR family NAD(P)-dependent oxidoreductase [Oscillatoria amoena NRMC-F 0135]|nr:SDR family NAD(P)-dependent oxidoreductase [Oscillatoria amoena NRMC-F 0135]